MASRGLSLRGGHGYFSEPNVQTDSLSLYTDTTSAWTMAVRRCTSANNTFLTNWLIPKFQISTVQGVEIATTVLSTEANPIILRGNYASQNGYLAYTELNGGTGKLQLVISRLDAGTLAEMARSADFANDTAYANWKLYYIRFTAIGSTLTATARRYDLPTVTQATVTVAGTTGGSLYSTGVVGVAALQTTNYFHSLAVWNPQTTVLNTAIDTQVMCVGDSITAGFLSGTDLAFPAYLQAYLGRGCLVINRGSGGAKIVDLVNDAAAVDALLNTTYRKNILCVMIGTNNLDTSTAAAWLTALASYLDARRTAGWKIMLLPVGPRLANNTFNHAFDVTANFETQRPTYNTGLAAFVTSHADLFVNINSVAVIGGAGAENNATYYGDGLHPTAALYRVYTPPIAAGILNLMVA